MNLIDQEKEDNKDEKIKKVLKTLIIITVIAFFIVLAIMIYFSYQESKTLKLSIDGNRVRKDISASHLFEFDNTSNKVYVSIQDIAAMVGYDYFNGDFKQLTEEQSKCYVNNKKEVAGFELGSNLLYKADPTVQNQDYDWFKLDEPVKTLNNKLYVTSEALAKACNLKFSYDKEKNIIRIFTLPYLISYYEPTVINKYGYAGIDSNYKNQKAILYDMLVVKKQESKDEYIYGVVAMDNKQIIGIKYDKIEYIEVANDFYVTVGEKTGISSSEGAQKIEPSYDEVKVLDNDTRLYYVKNNDLCGVLDRNGKRVAYIEYTKIGIDTSLFPRNNITNSMFLFENCIPVMKNNQWGLIDKNGNVLLEIAYDKLGFINGTKKDAVGNNLLIIPSIEGIVVCKANKYGIIKSNGEWLAPVAFDKIYSITNLGQDKVFLEYNGETYKLEDYLKLNSSQTDNTTTNTIQEKPSTEATNTAETNSVPTETTNQTQPAETVQQTQTTQPTQPTQLTETTNPEKSQEQIEQEILINMNS